MVQGFMLVVLIMAASLFVFMIFLLSTGSLAFQSHPLYQPHQDDRTNIFNLVSYGAVGDGFTDDTQAFQKAWNEVCNSSLPSPVLHVPHDKMFLLHPWILEGPCKSSNVHVEILGKMVAPSDPSEWQCDHHEGSYSCPSWLTFDHVNDLYITGGKGNIAIDGRGQKWWNLSCHKTKNCGRLPMMLIVRHSNNVRIENINIVNSPTMHLIIFSSTWVHVNNLNIKASKRSPNTDGIHISHSQNVFVHDSHIGTGDDCISIEDGSSHLNIDSIKCGPGHGISIGSLGGGGKTAMVEYVHISNVEFSETTNGVRIKTWPGGKGYARNIIFEKIQSRNAVYPIIIDQHYCDPHFKPCQHSHEESSAVKVSNITYNQVWGTSSKPTAIKFDCSKADSCTDIIVNDINIPSTRKGRKTSAYCKNVNGRAQGQVVPRVPCLNRIRLPFILISSAREGVNYGYVIVFLFFCFFG